MAEKMIKNLYVVSSPFQCINAVEARTQLCLDRNILVVIYYLKDGKENHLQMREIFGLLEWEDVIEIGLEKKKSKFFEYISIVNKLKAYKYENVFIGLFSQFQTILLSNLFINNIYAIDDGVATLKQHKDKLNPYIKEKIKFSKKIKMLRYSFVFLKTSFEKRKINYFTMFDIEPYYAEKIIKNEFIFMKKYFSNKKINNFLVYLLGQPLSEGGIVKEEDYLKYLKNIKQYYKNRHIKVMYVPHRREKGIERYKILEDDYFQIKKLHTAVEVYFFGLAVLPKEVSSFVSTALISLQKIFGTDTKSFYLKKDLLLRNHEFIESLYCEFQNNSIEVIKLEDL